MRAATRACVLPLTRCGLQGGPQGSAAGATHNHVTAWAAAGKRMHGLVHAGGPLNLDAAASHVSLHPSEVFSGRAAIQTPYAEYNVGADLPQMTERERLKMSKRVDKEERSMRAAAEAAQVGASRDVCVCGEVACNMV